MTALATIPTSSPLAVVAPKPAMSFAVPQEDAFEFYSTTYSDKVRNEVFRWLRILARVSAAGDAKGMRVRAMKAEARLAEVSFGSVSGKWYKYEASGGD